MEYTRAHARARAHTHTQPDDWAVAEGLLLKLSDFLEPWGGYKLEPVLKVGLQHVCVCVCVCVCVY